MEMDLNSGDRFEILSKQNLPRQYVKLFKKSHSTRALECVEETATKGPSVDGSSDSVSVLTYWPVEIITVCGTLLRYCTLYVGQSGIGVFYLI